MRRLPLTIGTLTALLSLDSAAALSDNLRGYWKFDESSGTAVRDSVVGEFATFAGATAGQWQSGVVGSSLSFNGIDNGVFTSTNPLHGSRAFSVQAWILKSAYAYGDIVSNQRYPDGGVVSGFDLQFIPDDFGATSCSINANSIAFTTGQAAGAGNSVWSTPRDSIALNIWYHVIAVWQDGSEPLVYLNGVSQPLRPWTCFPTNTTINWGTPTPLGIGADSQSYGRHWFSGKLDEVAVWDRALSASDVAALYNNGIGADIPLPPVILLQGLVLQIEAMNLSQGFENSLDSKLESAMDALDAARNGSISNACGSIQAFMNAVAAQTGIQLTDAEAASLLESAARIRAALDCS